MAGSITKRNTVKLAGPMPADTSANWALSTLAIPANMAVRDTTLGRVKIGDGTKTFSQLPWAIEASLPTEYRVLFDKLFTTADGGISYTLKTGTNIANAPVLAGADGLIRHDQLPAFLLNTVKVVGTYGDLLALGAEFHETLVLVVDPTNGTVTGGGAATPGDTTVAKGAATYIWYDPDGTGVLPESWNKTSEIGELDINWTEALSDHFKYKGDGANTLDDIADGTTYGKMTLVEIARLAILKVDYDSVQAAGAVMYDHPLYAEQIDAAGLDAFMALPTA